MDRSIQLRYDRAYREELSLPDGTRVALRMVRPEDKPMLVEGFERLSEESRYKRFFTAKNELTEEELRYFTEFDGYDHFALGAVTLRDDGVEDLGVGVARFVRLAEEPEVAEFALAVTDDMQGRGIGRVLAQRLVGAAVERDVRWFRCLLLAENDRMRDLIDELWGDAIYTENGAVLTAQFPLPSSAPGDEETPAPEVENVVGLLHDVARGTVLVPIAIGLSRSVDWLKRVQDVLDRYVEENRD